MKQEEVLCSDDGQFTFLNEFSKSKECAIGCYNIPYCGSWTYQRATGKCWFLERTVDNENHCHIMPGESSTSSVVPKSGTTANQPHSHGGVRICSSLK